MSGSCRPIPSLTAADVRRFRRLYRVRKGGCWQWIGHLNEDGYARFSVQSVKYQAHRVAYAIHVQQPDATLTIDHLCRNRGCVNPAHLEPVTIGENVRRGFGVAANARKTHCRHGHPFDAENTYVHRAPSGPHRVCKRCQSAAGKRYRDRLSAAKNAATGLLAGAFALALATGWGPALVALAWEALVR